VGGNAHQAKHGEIVSDVQSFAEIMQRIAAKIGISPNIYRFAGSFRKSFSLKAASKYNDQVADSGKVNMGANEHRS
jgi:hypothetical protein